jgi:hypothetical protein
MTGGIRSSGFNLNGLVKAAIAAPTSAVNIAEYMSYEQHQQNLANSSQNMEERKRYAECIYGFTCVWCIFLAIILIGKGTDDLNISDEVLITLITSTTINVFVFFRYVTKYLFNAGKST